MEKCHETKQFWEFFLNYEKKTKKYQFFKHKKKNNFLFQKRFHIKKTFKNLRIFQKI